MNQYYFLAASLPPLNLGATPEMSFQELEILLKTNLNKKDYESVIVLRRYYDIQNIAAFWKGLKADYRGNLDEVALENALLARTDLPDYIFNFIDRYENNEQRLHNFSQLISLYFQNELKHASGFLKDYLMFERDWRIVLAGLRSKQLGKDLALELHFEEPIDIISQITAQKDASSLIVPEEYLELQILVNKHLTNPLELQLGLNEFRYKKIEEFTGTNTFSINRILGYMLRLIIIEKWVELDTEKGLKILEKIVKLG